MDEQLISNLQDLGLSEKESRVYIANLMLGPSSVQRIADQAGIKRVTTYVILESLVSLGLVSQSVKGKKTFFIAEDPISLSRLIAKREEELKDQKSNFDSILPQLKNLKNSPTDVPSVRFYDSAEGIKSIVKTFYRSLEAQGIDTVYGFTNLDQLYAFFPEFRESSSNPTRVRSKVKSYMIYTSKEGAIFGDTDKTTNRTSRYVPIDKYPLSGDVSILGPYLIMVSMVGSKPIGITIRSEELAKGMLALFQLAWESAAKYNK